MQEKPCVTDDECVGRCVIGNTDSNTKSCEIPQNDIPNYLAKCFNKRLSKQIKAEMLTFFKVNEAGLEKKIVDYFGREMCVGPNSYVSL
jgi:hypothetical protein